MSTVAVRFIDKSMTEHKFGRTRWIRAADLYDVTANVARHYAESSLFIGASGHVPATQLNGLAAELLLHAAGSSYRIT